MNFYTKTIILTTLLLANQQGLAQKHQPNEWRLAFAGDIMLGTDWPQYALPANQGRGLLDAAQPSLSWANLAFGNLEGAMATGGTTGKIGCGKCYAFRTPPVFAQRLREAGFHGMSQANNHARDFGLSGLAQSAQALKNAGMSGTGWDGSTPAIFEHQGRKACLLAFAPNSGMNDIRNIPKAKALVSKASKQCPLVIVSFHGGAEGSDKTRTPNGVEHYLGENRGDVRAFARGMIDAGASIVYGHGPHVPRGMELYNGHLIAYSLGNFMTYGGMSVVGVLGQAPLLLVRLDQQGRLINGRIDSFRQSPRRAIAVDPASGAARTMQEATGRDFNGGGLLFTGSGQFQPSQARR